MREFCYIFRLNRFVFNILLVEYNPPICLELPGFVNIFHGKHRKCIIFVDKLEIIKKNYGGEKSPQFSGKLLRD